MSRLSARALGAVGWVSVVAVGAVLVWLVISRAGAGLVAEAGPVTAPATTRSPSSAGDPRVSSEPAAARRGTWQGEAGVVTAICRAEAIALVGAQPEDGVIVQVIDQGPDQLVVTFSGDDEPSVTVVAHCRDGRPQFSVSDTPSGDPSPTGATSPGSDEPTVPDGGGESDHSSGDDSGDDPGGDSRDAPEGESQDKPGDEPGED